MPSSRELPWAKDWTYVSCFAGGFFTAESPGKPRDSVVLHDSILSISVWYIEDNKMSPL